MTSPSAQDGPDPQDSPAAPRSTERPYRLSDHERTLAINALSEAFSEGRLDGDEFRERMSAASEAKLASDLDPLFVDLPGRTPNFLTRPSREGRPHTPTRPVRAPHPLPVGHPVRPGRSAPFGPMPGRPPRPLVFLPVVMLIIATTHFWFLLPLMFISLGMLSDAHRERSRRISGRTDPCHLRGGGPDSPHI